MNLFRDQFPYSSPPRLFFEETDPIPFDMPDDIFLTDTTFRDGQQARPPYTVEQITTLFDYLHRLSGEKGIIRQSEFFLYSERDRRAVEACMEKNYAYPQITAWIRAVKEDFKRVRDLGITETGILTSSSDYHIYLKLGLDREKAMNQYLDIVETALAHGISPRCHLEDITRADIHGFVIPFVSELMKRQEQTNIPIKIRLCDTMGFGVAYPEAVLPRSIPKLIRTLRSETGIESSRMEWHGHNDFYRVVSNATAAWLYGVAGVNGTLLGFGERTGNTPLEAMIFEYMSLTGDTSIDTTVITEIARFMESSCGYAIPPMTPFVGRDFNVTSAGIHADGVIKNEEIYNIFDTRKWLNRPVRINVTDKTGAAGVAFWVNEELGLKGEHRLDKKHPGIQKMADHVQKLYRDGRTTALSRDELLAAARLYLTTEIRGQRPEAKSQDSD
ncbi:MAG: 2-isopropylmalate synthase [Bacillaceae bacterium]|nr:2-isopropylmalate synthase [Bacillaceae bacterium]